MFDTVSFCGSEMERCGWEKLLTQQQLTSPHIKPQQKWVDSQEQDSVMVEKCSSIRLEGAN